MDLGMTCICTYWKTFIVPLARYSTKPGKMLMQLALLVPTALGLVARQSSGAPAVTVKNGTYNGVYQPTYNQDLFLGMPFAQSPVGDLRLQLPQSLNESWSDARQATQYYPECVGYGVSSAYPVFGAGTDQIRAMILDTRQVRTVWH